MSDILKIFNEHSKQIKNKIKDLNVLIDDLDNIIIEYLA